MQTAFAHGIDGAEEHVGQTQQAQDMPDPGDTALDFLYGATFIMLIVFILCLVKKEWTNAWKITLFTLLTVTVGFATIGLVGTTISENINSPTGGPVHWHADYLISVCGEYKELIDPRGFINKVGSPLLHEHNDDRIHLEGTPSSFDVAELGHFFETVGGELHSDHMTLPTPDGVVTVQNGDECNGEPGVLRVFVESEEDLDRVWHLEEDPEQYRSAPYTLVPPGDRIYISFDSADEETVLERAKGAAVAGFKNLQTND